MKNCICRLKFATNIASRSLGVKKSVANLQDYMNCGILGLDIVYSTIPQILQTDLLWTFRIESIASLASNQWDTSPRHQARRLSVSRSTDTLNLPAPPPASVSGSHFSPAQEETMDLPFSLK